MSQRKFDRAPFNGSVALCRQRSAVVVRPSNIGGGGILVSAPEALPTRTLLTLHIALPGEARGFTVMGRVVRSAAQELAVEFVGLMPSQRGRLEAYVQAHRSTVPQSRAG
jgi:hypothetical protein